MTGRRKALHELAGSGDDGTTGLLGGGRAPKDDIRIEANGTVDEASSAIGLARSLSRHSGVREICEELQRGLYRLGAEISTNADRTGAFGATTAADVERLDLLMRDLEAEAPMPAGFILPGSTPAGAALDLARAVVRRAERRIVTMAREGLLENPDTLRWVNRLSLLLFVLGRFEERQEGTAAKPAKPT
ncbi:MAG TPA: cob(I)yrinic acid a,c-diamide adenosyltransferase [Candidatus Dormibacteraeota bacterium]